MASDRIDIIADALAEAWLSGGTVSVLNQAAWPATLEEAFQAQDALDARLGWELAGWKIGLTNRAGQAAHGVNHPVAFGRLYAEITQTHPARFRMADYRNPPVVEGEFAFRLGADLPARAEPYGLDEVKAAVSAVVMTVDAVDTRWGVHPFELTVHQMNADSACSGAFVIGDELAGWREVDLAALPVRLFIDGELASGEVWTGDKRCTLDELYTALQWGTNELSRRSLGFKNGQVVTTGSPHEPIPAVADKDIIIRYGDIGEISVRFDS